SVMSVAFSPDGKTVLTGSLDYTAKLWDLNGREIQSFSGHAEEVESVAFSPDGKTVLTGSWDNTAKLWDLNGREIQSFSGHAEHVLSVAFSPDGKTVLTGHLIDTAKLWDLNGREIQSFSGHAEPVMSVAFSPDGKTVLTGSLDSTAKLWDLNGREIQSFSGHASFVESVAFSPDGKTVLTGSEDNTAKLWDLNGREIQSFSGHASSVMSVAFSPACPADPGGGKLVLTGSLDNTTKLWDTNTGKLRATLIAIDSNDWVVTTPSGLFDASPGAMKLMHYVQGLEVIELDQLKERYYEPGLLAKVTGFDKSGLRDVAAFDQIALYPEINANIDKNQLSINLSERSGGLGKLSLFINGKEVKEDLNPARQKNLTVDLGAFSKYYRNDTTNTLALRAFNQEGWLKSQAYELRYQPGASAKGEEGFKPTTPIHFDGQPSIYAVVVGTSNYAGKELDLNFADQDAEAISQAFQSSCTALFGADRTFVQLLFTGSKTPEGNSGKANIQKAFQDIAAIAKPEDVLLVYFSGHGIAYGSAEKELFYYLTKDIGSQDLSDPAIRSNYTVSSEELTQWLTAIPAQKQVMIIDACNAGKVVESFASIAQKNLDPSQIRALDRMKDRTGMFILTGSAGDKVSYEASQYGQGLLTYSLLQGMSGLALAEGKRVDVMKLFNYSRDIVPELARGIGGVQIPVLAYPHGDGASFDIGIVSTGVRIPLAQPKPVFIRSVFQDENFGDELELVSALEKNFQTTTLKGTMAKLIYSDVSEYEMGYSIRGSYVIKGNEVEVKGSLYKGKTLQGKFQVAGKKDDVPGLVKQILQAVIPMAK
ncbi:MAG: caspase family protein, partial [Saprospiraceae bacterium]